MNGASLRSVNLWIFVFVVVTGSAVYQRVTGPTYPVNGHFRIGANDIKFSFPRSFAGEGDAEFLLFAPDARIGGIVETMRLKSQDGWNRRDLVRSGDYLAGKIPHQPPAGKVAYRVYLYGGADPGWLTPNPVILRFKGDVPAAIMIPHIFVMFIAMLFSTRAGLEAILNRPNVLSLTVWTTISLAIGGLILGPVVQKLAFGAYWTGWPFGKDLTDNKTVVAFLFWAVALWRQLKQRTSKWWVVAAAVALLIVFLIPHSLLGSELDYQAPSG